MRVVFISPGYPAEMVQFTRGLAEVGAQVLGVGDQGLEQVPEPARSSLSGYLQVETLWNESVVIEKMRRWLGDTQVDRIECLWEPGMLLAARLRETFSVPGMGVEQMLLFRDKDRMKAALDAAGVRTPSHRRAGSISEIRQAAEVIGYPLIIKPIAGAGSTDTYRVADPKELDRVLELTRHVLEVSVEEFIEGEEHTFDTICIDGEIHYFNIAWYRPRVLISRSLQWVSPQTVTLRNVHHPELEPGRRLGRDVLDALGFHTGFTHMEWFLTPQGEAVFVEIAARAPGARSTELMNYGCDIDVFRGWAEAVCHERFTEKVDRKYNAVVLFKRAQGPDNGRITRIEGLGGLMARYGAHVMSLELQPIGAERRNWKQTLISDGYVIVRHPDLQTTLEMADHFGMELQIYAA